MKTIIEFEKAELNLLQNILQDEVQDLYDDPYGTCESKETITVYHNQIKNLFKKFHLSFDIIVEVETTQYERERMNKILSTKE